MESWPTCSKILIRFIERLTLNMQNRISLFVKVLLFIVNHALNIETQQKCLLLIKSLIFLNYKETSKL